MGPAERRRLPGSANGGTPSVSSGSNNPELSSSNASTDSALDLEEKTIFIPASEKQFDELFKLKDEFYSELLPHCGVELSSDGVWTVPASTKWFVNGDKQACKDVLARYLNAIPGFFQQKFAEIDAMKDDQTQGNWSDANVTEFCAELKKLIDHAHVLLRHSKSYSGPGYGSIKDLT